LTTYIKERMILSEKGRVNIKEKKRIHEDWRLKRCEDCTRGQVWTVFKR